MIFFFNFYLFSQKWLQRVGLIFALLLNVNAALSFIFEKLILVVVLEKAEVNLRNIRRKLVRLYSQFLFLC